MTTGGPPQNSAGSGRRPGTFAPGQSGNPGGRPKAVAIVRDLARAQTDVALSALVEIATAGTSEAARVSAAQAILDRGWGKPTQPIAGDGDAPAIQVIRRVIVDPAHGEQIPAYKK